MRLPLAALILATSSCLAAQPQASLDFPAVASFLKTHCRDCHVGADAEAGLDIFSLKTDLSDDATLERWVRVFDRVATGEMPPSEVDQPTAGERIRFTQRLSESLTAAHAEQKGTVLRRLNRQEYENTLNDLFGTNLKLASTLPADGRSHEFDNVGEALGISTVQVQRYLEAIEAVMDSSIAKTIDRPASDVVKAGYADTRGAEQFLGKQWLKLNDDSVVFFRRLSYPTGMLREANASEAGSYKIRVTGYAYQSDKPITFSIGATTFARGADKPTFGYYSMPPGKPTTIEIEAWLDDRYMVQIEPMGISDAYEIKRVGIENYRGPGLAISHVEVEGPLAEQFPSLGHRLMFDGLNRREKEPSNPTAKSKSWYKPEFEIAVDDPKTAVRPVLIRITTAAFRRPTSDSDIKPYANLFNAELDAGATVEDALKTATAAVFCAPDFLFLKEPAGLLNDFALASRLSYFLTRTTPDAQLLAAARAGQVAEENGSLEEHVDRLLQGESFDRFIADFTDSWLNLRDIEFTTPDNVLFPEFDSFLKHSIVGETREFLRELIRSNLPVRHLVKSDFAMLNSRLADHYEIAGVDGPELRKVKLPADSLRGGFLSQASVLKVSANGTNTSPVVRGVFVMERILGQVPPPPPAGISGVEPDIRGATTLRQLLDKHRNVDSCRSCHEMIDPPGFALESFNPIGTYRERFRSLGEGDKVDLQIDGNRVRYKLGPAVDASGQFKNGRSFDGFRDFRDILAEDEDRLATAFVTKLLTFGTGRDMGFSDREPIRRLVQASKAKGHGIKDLIHLVVNSEIFRSK